MRSACPFADPSQILLDRVTMPGKEGTGRARASWEALRGIGQLTADSLPSVAQAPTSRPARSARGQHDPVRIRSRSVQQFDLEPDYRVESSRVRRAGKADRAIETGMIRDGEAGQPQFHRSLDQVVWRRSTIEKREVGVTVKFRVSDLDHGSPPSGGGLGQTWGPAIIEQMFYV